MKKCCRKCGLEKDCKALQENQKGILSMFFSNLNFCSIELYLCYPCSHHILSYKKIFSYIKTRKSQLPQLGIVLWNDQKNVPILDQEGNPICIFRAQNRNINGTFKKKSKSGQANLSSVSDFVAPTPNSRYSTLSDVCSGGPSRLSYLEKQEKLNSKRIIPMIIKYGSKCQENIQRDYSRTPTPENRLDIFGGQNDVTVSKNQISIKVEQGIECDLEQEELEDYAIKPLKNNFQKTKNIITNEQVTIKVKQDLVTGILKQEELDYIDVKVDEDGALDTLCLMKQDIITNEQVTIKIEQDVVTGNLKQEELDYIDVKVDEDGALDTLCLMKQEIITNEQVTIKIEQDLVTGNLKQEELDYVDVKVDEDGALDTLCLMKQEMKENYFN